jgi:hypothetical protein
MEKSVMTEGVVETKGTRIFFGYSPGASSSDADGFVVHQLACPTALNDLSSGERPRQDMTCLSSLTRQYFAGLADPPQITIPVNFIPRSEAHQAIIAAKAQGSALVLPWMVVLSDQAGSPTTVDSNGKLVSPGSTTVGWKAYVSNFSVTAAVGAIWTGNITLQLQFDDGDEDLDWDLPDTDLLP